MESVSNHESYIPTLHPGDQAVLAMARRIAFESPELADLTPEQLERVAQAVLVGNLTSDLKRRADLERIDYAAEREAFLVNAGRTKSPHTRAAYSRAMDRVDAWSARRGVRVVELKAKDADDFIYFLQTQGRAPGSVRLDVAGVSSFFTFLARRFDQIQNPFRGTKARPERRASREVQYPTRDEVQAILVATESPSDRAAFAVMAYRGLRVGALPSLSIRSRRFSARSKAKSISGEVPEEALKVLLEAELDLKRPFDSSTSRALAARFRYVTGKLAAKGTITAPYSVHDLRHFFAVDHYRRNKDIYGLKELLGHSSIQVTEVYLKGIGLL